MPNNDWINRVNDPVLLDVLNRKKGYLPANFGEDFEPIPERGYLDAFLSGVKEQGAGVLQGQAEFLNTLGIGDGATANYLNEVMQNNARRRNYTWEDMVDDPWKYITDPEGLIHDLGGGVGSSAVLLGETAVTGGVGGAAARAVGLAGKIGSTARMVAAISDVAGEKAPWLIKALKAPAGKLLIANVMKTPLEAASEGGNIARDIRESGGSHDEQLSGMLKGTALNMATLAFTNSLESAGLGKMLEGLGGKKAVSDLTGEVIQEASKKASDPGFVQKHLMPSLKAGYEAGKTLTGMGLQNAYEEGTQESISQYAKDEKDSLVDVFNPAQWNEEAKTAAAIGGVTGIGQGGIMTGIGKGVNYMFGEKEDKQQELKTPNEEAIKDLSDDEIFEAATSMGASDELLGAIAEDLKNGDREAAARKFAELNRVEPTASPLRPVEGQRQDAPKPLYNKPATEDSEEEGERKPLGNKRIVAPDEGITPKSVKKAERMDKDGYPPAPEEAPKPPAWTTAQPKDLKNAGNVAPYAKGKQRIGTDRPVQKQDKSLDYSGIVREVQNASDAELLNLLEKYDKNTIYKEIIQGELRTRREARQKENETAQIVKRFYNMGDNELLGFIREADPQDELLKYAKAEANNRGISLTDTGNANEYTNPTTANKNSATHLPAVSDFWERRWKLFDIAQSENDVKLLSDNKLIDFIHATEPETAPESLKAREQALESLGKIARAEAKRRGIEVGKANTMGSYKGGVLMPYSGDGSIPRSSQKVSIQQSSKNFLNALAGGKDAQQEFMSLSKDEKKALIDNILSENSVDRTLTHYFSRILKKARQGDKASQTILTQMGLSDKKSRNKKVLNISKYQPLNIQPDYGKPAEKVRPIDQPAGTRPKGELAPAQPGVPVEPSKSGTDTITPSAPVEAVEPKVEPSPAVPKVEPKVKPKVEPKPVASKEEKETPLPKGAEFAPVKKFGNYVLDPNEKQTATVWNYVHRDDVGKENPRFVTIKKYEKSKRYSVKMNHHMTTTNDIKSALDYVERMEQQDSKTTEEKPKEEATKSPQLTDEMVDKLGKPVKTNLADDRTNAVGKAMAEMTAQQVGKKPGINTNDTATELFTKLNAGKPIKTDYTDARATAASKTVEGLSKGEPKLLKSAPQEEKKVNEGNDKGEENKTAEREDNGLGKNEISLDEYKNTYSDINGILSEYNNAGGHTTPFADRLSVVKYDDKWVIANPFLTDFNYDPNVETIKIPNLPQMFSSEEKAVSAVKQLLKQAESIKAGKELTFLNVMLKTVESSKETRNTVFFKTASDSVIPVRKEYYKYFHKKYKGKERYVVGREDGLHPVAVIDPQGNIVGMIAPVRYSDDTKTEVLNYVKNGMPKVVDVKAEKEKYDKTHGTGLEIEQIKSEGRKLVREFKKMLDNSSATESERESALNTYKKLTKEMVEAQTGFALNPNIAQKQKEKEEAESRVRKFEELAKHEYRADRYKDTSLNGFVYDSMDADKKKDILFDLNRKVRDLHNHVEVTYSTFIENLAKQPNSKATQKTNMGSQTEYMVFTEDGYPYEVSKIQYDYFSYLKAKLKAKTEMEDFQHSLYGFVDDMSDTQKVQVAQVLHKKSKHFPTKTRKQFIEEAVLRNFGSYVDKQTGTAKYFIVWEKENGKVFREYQVTKTEYDYYNHFYKDDNRKKLEAAFHQFNGFTDGLTEEKLVHAVNDLNAPIFIKEKVYKTAEVVEKAADSGKFQSYINTDSPNKFVYGITSNGLNDRGLPIKGGRQLTKTAYDYFNYLVEKKQKEETKPVEKKAEPAVSENKKQDNTDEQLAVEEAKKREQEEYDERKRKSIALKSYEISVDDFKRKYGVDDETNIDVYNSKGTTRLAFNGRVSIFPYNGKQVLAGSRTIDFDYNPKKDKYLQYKSTYQDNIINAESKAFEGILDIIKDVKIKGEKITSLNVVYDSDYLLFKDEKGNPVILDVDGYKHFDQKHKGNIVIKRIGGAENLDGLNVVFDEDDNVLGVIAPSRLIDDMERTIKKYFEDDTPVVVDMKARETEYDNRYGVQAQMKELEHNAKENIRDFKKFLKDNNIPEAEQPALINTYSKYINEISENEQYDLINPNAERQALTKKLKGQAEHYKQLVIENYKIDTHRPLEHKTWDEAIKELDKAFADQENWVEGMFDIDSEMNEQDKGYTATYYLKGNANYDPTRSIKITVDVKNDRTEVQLHEENEDKVSFRNYKEAEEMLHNETLEDLVNWRIKEKKTPNAASRYFPRTAKMGLFTFEYSDRASAKATGHDVYGISLGENQYITADINVTPKTVEVDFATTEENNDGRIPLWGKTFKKLDEARKFIKDLTEDDIYTFLDKGEIDEKKEEPAEPQSKAEPINTITTVSNYNIIEGKDGVMWLTEKAPFDFTKKLGEFTAKNVTEDSVGYSNGKDTKAITKIHGLFRVDGRDFRTLDEAEQYITTGESNTKFDDSLGQFHLKKLEIDDRKAVYETPFSNNVSENKTATITKKEKGYAVALKTIYYTQRHEFDTIEEVKAFIITGKVPRKRNAEMPRKAVLMESLIDTELVNNGFVNLVGKEVHSAQDLAEIAQVLRNPGYEKTHRVYVDKNGKIIRHETITVRMPNMSYTSSTEDESSEAFKKAKEEYKKIAEDKEVDKVYFLHNHPDGNPTPSNADRINAALALSSEVGDKFGGSIVIDTTKFAVIDKNGNDKIYDLDEDKQISFDTKDLSYHLVGTKFGTINDLASLCKKINFETKSVALVQQESGDHSKPRIVRSVYQLPNEISDLEPNVIARYLRGVARAGYGYTVVVVTSDQELLYKLSRLDSSKIGAVINVDDKGKILTSMTGTISSENFMGQKRSSSDAERIVFTADGKVTYKEQKIKRTNAKENFSNNDSKLKSELAPAPTPSGPYADTQRLANVTKNSQPKSFWKQVKEDGSLKALYKKFYADWVDQEYPLQALIDRFAEAMGRPVTREENVRERATAITYNAAGISNALLNGTGDDITAINNHLMKNVKLPYKVTLQTVMDKIKKPLMDKMYPNYLKDAGFNTWHEAFSNYLLAKRLREMYDIRKEQYVQAVKEAKAEGKKPPKWEDWEYKLPNGIKREMLDRIIAMSPKPFEEASKLYYMLNDNLMALLEDGGLIDKTHHDNMNNKYKAYCPLMRDFSDTAAADAFLEGIGKGGTGIGNVNSPVYKIKEGGSERNLISPLESTYNAISIYAERCERNKVGQMAVGMSEKAGTVDLIVEMPEGTSPSSKESTFSVMFNGKKRIFQCEPSLYGPIAGYNVPAASMTFRVATMAANALRTGATMSPSFIVRNIFRDTFSAGVNSDNGFIPIVDTIKGIIALKKNPEITARFKAAGVDQFNFYGNGEARYKKLEEMTEESHWYQNPIKAIYNTFRDWAELGEAGTRMGEFMRALEKGKDDLRAAEDARDVTLNFTRMGAYGGQVNKVVPFFNACIQGGDKLIRTFHKDFVGTCVRTFEYIILPSLILWALNHDEDWYKELAPEMKNSYWFLGKTVKVPKPQEIGILFGGGVEMLLDEATNADPNAMKNWKDTLIGVMLPGAIPTAILPVIEWQANYNFFRQKEIVSQKLQRLPDKEQYNSGTSEISKALGRLADLSPVKIDNTISTLTGTMGMFTWQMIGEPFSDKEEPERKWFERPFIRDFAVTDMNLGRSVNEFYEINNNAEKEYAAYGKKGRPSMAVKAIRAAYKSVSALNKDIRAIKERNISPTKKRELIDKKKALIKKIASKIVAKYGEHYL